MEPYARYYDALTARQLLAQGHIVFVAGGTGNPFFTTDSASALRGIEIQADIMLKGTRVDGIYTADPERDPSATKLSRLTYQEVYDRGLRIMDLTAMTLCQENHLPIIVFDMDTTGNLARVMRGEEIGSIVSSSIKPRNQSQRNMSTSQFTKPAEQSMLKAVEFLQDKLDRIRAGKANPVLLDDITVEAYGAPMPLNQVATVTVPDARTLAITPWDKKLIKDIEKGILDSNLGITPTNNGEMIRIAMPPLTEERRKELVKQCKAESEEAKISIRNARRDAIDAAKKAVKAEDLPEDTIKQTENDAQKLHDKYIGRVEEALAAKEKEIMTI